MIGGGREREAASRLSVSDVGERYHVDQESTGGFSLDRHEYRCGDARERRSDRRFPVYRDRPHRDGRRRERADAAVSGYYWQLTTALVTAASPTSVGHSFELQKRHVVLTRSHAAVLGRVRPFDLTPLCGSNPIGSHDLFCYQCLGVSSGGACVYVLKPKIVPSFVEVVSQPTSSTARSLASNRSSLANSAAISRTPSSLDQPSAR